MSLTLIIILSTLVIIGINIYVVFLLSGRKEREARSTQETHNTFALLQQNLAELTASVDTKLGENTRLMQSSQQHKSCVTSPKDSPN
jgi:flagellar basal body-associated protein FliL